MTNNNKSKPALLDIIKNGIAATESLSRILENERKYYTNRTIEQSAPLLEDKNKLLEQLDTIASELAEILGITQDKSGTINMKSMIQGYDNKDEIIDIWNVFIANLEHCRKSNLTNGVIINHQLISTRQLLCIIRNDQDTPLAESYNKQGINNTSLKSKTIARI